MTIFTASDRVLGAASHTPHQEERTGEIDVLLRNSVYFDGHGIGQALTVLLAYTVITAVILTFLDWYRSPELSVPGVDQQAATETAAVAAPVGPLP